MCVCASYALGIQQHRLYDTAQVGRLTLRSVEMDGVYSPRLVDVEPPLPSEEALSVCYHIAPISTDKVDVPFHSRLRSVRVATFVASYNIIRQRRDFRAGGGTCQACQRSVNHAPHCGLRSCRSLCPGIRPQWPAAEREFLNVCTCWRRQTTNKEPHQWLSTALRSWPSFAR